MLTGSTERTTAKIFSHFVAVIIVAMDGWMDSHYAMSVLLAMLLLSLLRPCRLHLVVVVAVVAVVDIVVVVDIVFDVVVVY